MKSSGPESLFKRIAPILLAAIFAALSLFGCRGAESPAGPETKNYCFDYRVRTMAAVGNNYIMETDDTVYFLLHGVLYCSDTQNKDFMPLCPRPDCDHKSMDCSAYIDALAFTVFGDSVYYVDGFYDSSYFLNGKYIENLGLLNNEDILKRAHSPEDKIFPSLWRMNSDGTEHEKLIDLPVPEYDRPIVANGWFFCFSGKYLLAGCRQASGTETFFDMYSLELDTYERHTLSFDSFDFTVNQWPAAIAGRGDTLYCCVCDVTNFAADGSKPTFLCALDLKTGEVSEICGVPEDIFSAEFCFYLAEDALYYMCWSPGDVNRRLYKCGLSSGESVLIDEGAYGEIRWNQFDWQSGTLFVDYRGDSETMPKGVYCTDTELNAVDFAPYTDEGLEDVKKVRAFFQTESYIFGAGPDKHNAYGAQNGVPEWYMDKADIGTGNFTWKRWAPEE